jgi:carboxyl-terminal processing protease
VGYKLLADPQVGYVRVGFFGPDTAAQVRSCLGALARKGARGLVLDLRNNPGGDFPQGVEVAGLFAAGPLLNVETRQGQSQLSGSGVAWTGPVAVLINQGSASASEIVGQALQGRPGRVLVGQTSFGKARIQTLYPLPGGAGMNLTTGRYLSLSGLDLHGRGLKPDLSAVDALPAATQWLLKAP